MKVLVVLSLFIVSSLSAQADCAAEEKQIIVVFRYDDYSSRSSTDLELKLIDVFQRHNIPCTFGVIPFVTDGDWEDTSPQGVIPLTGTKANILNSAIKAGILDVALHGYSHQTIRKKTILTKDGDTEFSGLVYDDQLQKIEKGRKFLEKVLNTSINTFIPPWNSYDLNTIRALEKLGFSILSASVKGKAEESSQLKFLPSTCNLLQIRASVKSARRIQEFQPIMIVLFHGYDFFDIDKERGMLTYQEFLELLNWLTSQKDIHIMSINQATNVVGDLSASRFLMNRSEKSLLWLIPPLFLSNPIFDHFGLYLSSNNSPNMKIKNIIYVSLFYFVILLISTGISFYGGLILFPVSRRVTSIFKYGGLALLILFSIYTVYDLDVYCKGAIVITVLLGACIGIWVSCLKIRKQSRLKHVRRTDFDA